jgi:hypothetical protein
VNQFATRVALLSELRVILEEVLQVEIKLFFLPLQSTQQQPLTIIFFRACAVENSLLATLYESVHLIQKLAQ